MKWTFALLLILLAACTTSGTDPTVTIITADQEHHVSVELAQSSSEQAQGLMHRTTLEKDAGMYFVFNQEAPRSFWMKNTLIPLDILFIDADGIIVDIQYATPCVTETCATYSSRSPAQYVLEVNGNYTKEKEIKIGDSVYLKSAS
jgi:uncharacterized membrane protein (UPF0127 family)